MAELIENSFCNAAFSSLPQISFRTPRSIIKNLSTKILDRFVRKELLRIGAHRSKRAIIAGTILSLSIGYPNEPSNNVTWDEETNFSVVANPEGSLMSAGGTTGSWEAGISSLNFLAGNEDGSAEVEIVQAGSFSFGLTHKNIDPHFNSIEHSFWMVGGNGGDFRIGISRVLLGVSGQHHVGDTFRVSRINGEMIFFNNGVQQYQYKQEPKEAILVADVSFPLNNQAKIAAKVSFAEVDDLKLSTFSEIWMANV